MGAHSNQRIGDGSPDNTNPTPGEQPPGLNLVDIATAKKKAGTTQDLSMVVDGTTREYSVHTPKNWDGKTPLPVLYFLNGMSPAKPDDTTTGLREMADKKGFMLVDIIGAGPLHSFNNGQGVYKGHNLDENKFLNAVHEKLESQYPLDETRQGLTGFSQGGSEALALAAKNGWISSVQPVEGYTTGKEAPLTRPISAQLINAEHDQIIAIGGTKSLTAPALLSSLLPPGAMSAIDALQGANATPSQGSIFSRERSKVEGAVASVLAGLADRSVVPIMENFSIVGGADNYIEPQQYTIDLFKKANAAGAATITRSNGNTIEDYVSTATGAEVKAVQLGSGGHGWAGSTKHDYDIPGIGEPNETYNANEEITDFFLAHKLGH